MGRFSGKIAVITGAGPNRAATARRFGSEEATVAHPTSTRARRRRRPRRSSTPEERLGVPLQRRRPGSVTGAVAAVASSLGVERALQHCRRRRLRNTTEVPFDEWQCAIA
jgi:NAD(P)-dependent dehydrogenase (short-subunit alcohol dehydrogenase family)